MFLLTGIYADDYAITGCTCTGQTLAPQATCSAIGTFTATANLSNRSAALQASDATKALSGARDLRTLFAGVPLSRAVDGYYRLNSGSDKGLSLGRFHGRLPAFG